MTPQQFHQRYRQTFGCKARAGEVCWCDVCRAMATAYREIVLEASEAMCKAMGVEPERTRKDGD